MIEKAVSIGSSFNFLMEAFVFLENSVRIEGRKTGAMRWVFGWNWIPKGRICSLAPYILLAAVAAGCSLPPYETTLEKILKQEGITYSTHYGYRCTAGAHRGASRDHIENTLAALKAADNNNRYAFIEFDVQYSSDRKIVVYHDKRMLRLYGNLSAIGNKTFGELARISHGEIAAYDDVIVLLGKKINIEIKSQGDKLEDECLADEIVDDLKARGRIDAVMISSISGDLIKYIHQRYPDVPTGQIFWLTSSTYLHFDALTKRLYQNVNETHADYVMLHMANLHNIDDLLEFKPRDKTIVFWDFDDRIYIVHKDISDRLWGDSIIKSIFQFIRFQLVY